MPNKMKSNNPPRRVEIRGQDHLLAYITPAEAQLLMDNGGTGEAGPMGIPAFPEPGMGGPGDSRGGAGNGSDSGGTSGDGPDGGGFTAGDPGEMSAADAAQAAAVAAAVGEMGMSPGESQARYGTPAFAGRTTAPSDAEVAAVGRAPSSERGFDVKTAKAITDIMMAKQMGWVDRAALDAYAKGKNLRGFTPAPPGYPGVFSSFQAEQSMPPGLLSAAFGILGLPTKGYVTTGWGDMGGAPDGAGPEIVPTQTNPVTGQEECPSGYIFDADLQACRLDTTLQNVGDTVGGTGFDYQPGTYARMGLLDVAPEGLKQFASTYGTGFGTAPDYEAANLAYRKPVGTMSDIFQDPYNLQGMTLLA